MAQGEGVLGVQEVRGFQGEEPGARIQEAGGVTRFASGAGASLTRVSGLNGICSMPYFCLNG
jgi:hypothetical protein